MDTERPSLGSSTGDSPSNASTTDVADSTTSGLLPGASVGSSEGSEGGEEDESTDSGEQQPACGNGRLEPLEQCDDGNLEFDDGCLPDCTVALTCQHIIEVEPSVGSGAYVIDPDGTGGEAPFSVYCDMETDDGGWTLAARFSNADAESWMLDSGEWWYVTTVESGQPTSRDANEDLLSAAFWSVPADEFKLSRTDNPDDGFLLQTTDDCLGGGTFREHITSFGDFQNGAVWGQNSVAGSCDVDLGNNYAATEGFGQATCDLADIGGPYSVSFWAAWGSGDGAVIMIGGGGELCSRADHGIGTTAVNQASFDSGSTFLEERDFAENTENTALNPNYALNLFVR
ncbi:MAG: fibrinogen-like YCDxxxxGGGW domain-containing protein [Myxococcota bacterium]